MAFVDSLSLLSSIESSSDNNLECFTDPELNSNLPTIVSFEPLILTPNIEFEEFQDTAYSENSNTYIHETDTPPTQDIQTSLSESIFTNTYIVPQISSVNMPNTEIITIMPKPQSLELVPQKISSPQHVVMTINSNSKNPVKTAYQAAPSTINKSKPTKIPSASFPVTDYSTSYSPSQRLLVMTSINKGTTNDNVMEFGEHALLNFEREPVLQASTLSVNRKMAGETAIKKCDLIKYVYTENRIL